MFVCCCLAVTQSEVETAIASGAHSREAVTTVCRAGGDCGACHGMIETMIEDHLEDMVTSQPPSVAPAAPCSGERLVAAERLVHRGRAA
jgi:bacterioferritin-associated ferredoxin